MYRRFIRKLGVVRTTILLSLFAVIISVFLTVTIELALGMDRHILILGIVISTIAPAIIAPLITFFTLRLLAQVDRAERERARLVTELQEALATAKTLGGLLPICASCKKIRDDEGYWHQVEIYVRDHSEADFTHGMCPDCAKNWYTELDELKRQRNFHAQSQ